jgi:hypothetical protein
MTTTSDTLANSHVVGVLGEWLLFKRGRDTILSAQFEASGQGYQVLVKQTPYVHKIAIRH